MEGIDLASVLSESLRALNTPQKPRIRPSALGLALGPEHDGCQLSWWEQVHGAPVKEPSNGELLMFRQGDNLHEDLVILLMPSLMIEGWEIEGVEEEARFYGVTGTYDLKIRHRETGTTVVIDFKTKRGNAFRYLDEPKSGDVLQVQFYVAAEIADYGVLLYVDREGQNFVRQFEVERDDERVCTAIDTMRSIWESDEPPEPVGLKLSRRQNKGADSVYLKLPWQIEWCRLETCSCLASLPKTPPSGIVAKVKNDGLVIPTKGNEGWMPIVLRLLREEYPDEDLYVDQELFK